MNESRAQVVPRGALAIGGATVLAAALLGAGVWSTVFITAEEDRGAVAGRGPEPVVSTPSAAVAPSRSTTPDPALVGIESFASVVASVDDGRDSDRSSPNARRAPAAGDGAASPRDAAEPEVGRIDGEALVALLPRSVISLAGSTVWDEPMVSTLERLMLLAFDADGDGVLDDFERIVAVRSLRDAMWPEAAAEAWASSSELGASAGGGAAVPRVDAVVLSPEDRRLHHDVDERRRFDRERDREAVGGAVIAGELDAEFRADIVRRFRLEDTGRLTAAEFARFMRHYGAGSVVADLNLDGVVDESDLRLFLDVASPIEDES